MTTLPDPASFSTQSWRSPFSALVDIHKSLQLANPGQTEDISKEVTRNVFLNMSAFTGFKASISKSYSNNFHLSHQWAMDQKALPPYGFTALYAQDNLFMQGMMDNTKSFQGILSVNLKPGHQTKIQAQFNNDGESEPVLHIAHDVTNSSSSASIKLVNFSILDRRTTGVVTASYLQSITPKLALGMEGTWARQSTDVPDDFIPTFFAKYSTPSSIFAGQFSPKGGAAMTFWKRISERVEAGVEFQLAARNAAGSGMMMMMGPPKIEGITTVGVKYEYRQACYRAQVDSNGKIGAFFERRILPPLGIQMCAEVDHIKNASKFGVGFSLDIPSDEQIAQSNAQEGAYP
ncbi:Mitochondrial import receptor subunit TOM40 [Neolecta irregularis DAH-3]|uniref:Mitochondrial import receptor subunit TOM40 n=1 Tax=Neolecta irregularis (strain DAH-3) TaxID=1198029 RepID=A0A1U7LII6_NEOID|nr:Mitochondrial import receptor subunit TOM40 [Neolecta irregularis DAH-3]|eukprot:OLL22362.1 Mitochondrial import receptor subunit TOM40 [Neolecta irregularis DAH-3]